MLKIILLFMAYLALATGMKVNLTRYMFYINKKGAENTYLRAEDIKKENVSDTEDITLTWRNEYAKWKEDRLKMDLYIHYGTKHPSQITRFKICDENHSRGIDGLAGHWFDLFVANYKKDSRCPIPNESAVNPGHLLYSRSITTGIYCNDPATVHLLIYENMLRLSDYGRQYDDQHKIFEVAYTGIFTECG
ncbi:uncharacterized protein LOC117174454 isoform X2 [Belonocnema kinseyi]|uniref:uncharacterized protein LOC117174454 isoform X2 n=1 Tax=Belonocnema kinseyi TaxID=2817044 RepID=UPI00143CE5B5|nr:uncharacterized protein LOC117174454 isoform X2 [Belonocnema kinseyi]